VDYNKMEMVLLITGDIFRDILNGTLVFLLAVIFIVVFRDCRKQGIKVFSSIFWGFVASTLIPPLGLAIYVIYRNKNWLS